MAAQLGQGTKLFWSNDNDGTVSDWAQIKGITNVTAPFGQNEEVDATNLERPRTSGREFLKGFREDASINISLQFDPDDSVHQTLVTRQASQAKTAFLIEMPQSGTGVTTIHASNTTIRNLVINSSLNAIQSATFDILMRAAPTIVHGATAQT